MIKIKEKIFIFFQQKEKYLLFFLIIFLFSLAISTNWLIKSDNDLSKLGWSFLHGKTHFINDISNADLIFKNNKLYLAIPPFPAIIFMPFNLIFQKPINQNAIAIFLTIGLFFLIYLLVKNRFGFSAINSLWLALAYLFTSVFIIATFFSGNANFFCHLVTTILLILCFIEFFGKKRYWLIGLLIGLTLMTRYTTGIAGLFFALFILTDQNNNFKKRLINLLHLSLPIFISLIIILGFNYLRFGNILEFGYKNTFMYQDHSEIRPFGVFNYKYIPFNLYSYFLNCSVSFNFFLVSPLFLLLFTANYKDKIIKYLLSTSLIILTILLSYYYNGLPQLGPRYANDFLPLIFIILLYSLKEKGLNYKHKLLIIFSALLNTTLILFS